MSYDALLAEDTVTVQRPTIAKDTSGGSTHLPFVDKAEAVEIPARVESLSSDQRLKYQQLDMHVAYRVFLPGDTDIDNGDVLVTSDGILIRVVGRVEYRAMGGIDSYLEILGADD